MAAAGCRLIAGCGRSAVPLLFPDRCRLCGRFFHRQVPAARCGDPLLAEALAPLACPACLAASSPLGAPLCTRCGRAFAGPEDSGHLCDACTRTPLPFRHARAAGHYRGALMRAIHVFKYRGRMEVGRALGGYLFRFFAALSQRLEVDLLTPVPLHAHRMRSRGFNQAWYLVRHWPRHQVGGMGLTLCRDLLCRTRPTRSQVGLAPAQRKANIRNAFAVTAPQRVAGKNILLVDDVFTTGATAAECTRTLLDAGAAAVDVLTLARTP